MAADPKLNPRRCAYKDVSLVDIGSASRPMADSLHAERPIINSSMCRRPVAGPRRRFGNEARENIVARRAPVNRRIDAVLNLPDAHQRNRQRDEPGRGGDCETSPRYEAIGDPSTDPVAPSGAPSIAWRNYEIYRAGRRAVQPHLSGDTVDSAGRVYAFWTDGNHIFTKSDSTGAAWNPAGAPVQIPNFGTDQHGAHALAASMAAGGAAGSSTLSSTGRTKAPARSRIRKTTRTMSGTRIWLQTVDGERRGQPQGERHESTRASSASTG